MDRICTRCARVYALSLLLALANPGLSQAQTEVETEPFRGVSAGPVRIKQDVINHQVKNQSGENLGTVDDVVADSGGRILYAVMSPSGDLKMLDQSVMVPWLALNSTEEGHLLLAMTKEQIAEAPSVKKGAWPDLAANDWNTKVFAFYGLAYLPSKSDFAELDHNDDGKLSQEEAHQLDRLGANFGKVDRNGNGSIEKAEFAAFEESLRPGGIPLDEQGAEP